MDNGTAAARPMVNEEQEFIRIYRQLSEKGKKQLKKKIRFALRKQAQARQEVNHGKR